MIQFPVTIRKPTEKQIKHAQKLGIKTDGKSFRVIKAVVTYIKDKLLKLGVLIENR
jgi:hypothetical protein